ncbi:MAG: head decoration protein [Desulfarculus sp.]|nr:head decoration protein [Desulfarculus sp.]
MSRDYGVTVEAVTRDSLLGDHPPVIQAKTILTGQVLVLGTVLAMTAAGKFRGLALETEVTAEELVADAGGSLKIFEGHLANPGVVPGSVVINATVGAAVKTMSDAGNGKLSGTGGTGLIDYSSGYYRLLFTTAPDDNTAISAAYSHDAAGTAVAAGVLLEAIDASEADEAGNVLTHGVVTADDLVWPEGITAAQKTRALAQLAQAGIRAL